MSTLRQFIEVARLHPHDPDLLDLLEGLDAVIDRLRGLVDDDRPILVRFPSFDKYYLGAHPLLGDDVLFWTYVVRLGLRGIMN